MTKLGIGRNQEKSRKRTNRPKSRIARLVIDGRALPTGPAPPPALRCSSEMFCAWRPPPRCERPQPDLPVGAPSPAPPARQLFFRDILQAYVNHVKYVHAYVKPIIYAHTKYVPGPARPRTPHGREGAAPKPGRLVRRTAPVPAHRFAAEAAKRLPFFAGRSKLGQGRSSGRAPARRSAVYFWIAPAL